MAADQPNMYELRHGSTRVTYSLTGPAGPDPRFTYEERGQTRTFERDQIETTGTPVGTLITVMLNLVPDAEKTTFSLMLPSVNLVGKTSCDIATFGLTTVQRTSFAGLGNGQIDRYTVTHELAGTASLVMT